MSGETQLLNTLFSAASGLAPDLSAPRPPAAETPGGEGWPRFLALLARQTRAETAALHLTQQGRPVQSWHHGTPPPPPEEAARMRSNRVYAQGDLPGLWDRSAPLRGIRCPAGPEGAALLMLHRPPDPGEDFRAIDGVQLSGLAPYLGPALMTWQALERERRRAARDAAQARALGAGWILFTPGAMVRDLSPGLAARLDTHAGIRIAADGRMSFANPATGAALHQALQGSTPGAPPALLCLRETPLLELLLTPAPEPAERLVLGQLRSAPEARALPLDTLARHCGLSRSEARLAQRICDGLSLAEAAGDLGWTVETARSTSKQIYARMGVSGQPGVIRRLLGGALWLQDLPKD